MRAAGHEVFASVAVLVLSLALIWAGYASGLLAWGVTHPAIGLGVIWGQALVIDKLAASLTNALQRGDQRFA